MKALSIRQPWAWAILHAGKDVENRDWKDTNPSMHVACRLSARRELFLIHASAGMTRREYMDFVDDYQAIELGHPDLKASGKPTRVDVPALDVIPRGGIVGVARLVGIVHRSIGVDEYETRDRERARVRRSPWFFGPLGFALADIKALPFLPFKGARGFFDVPDDLVREALAA